MNRSSGTDGSGDEEHQPTHTESLEDVELTRATLADNQARYRVLTESMRDVVWVLDTETLRFLYVSPSVYRLRGYTPAEIQAEPMDAALTPEGSAYVRAAMAARAQQVRDGQLPSTEFFVDEVEQPRKDGSTVWTEVITSFHLNPDTDRVEVWGVTRDISERRAAAEALAQSQAQYRALAENASDLVYRMSTNGVLEWTSPSTEELLGWTPEELVGKQAAELIHPDDRAVARSRIAEALSGQSVSMEVRVSAADGRYLWLGVTARQVLDDAGTLIGLVGSGRDVTAEVEGRLALLRSEQRLRLVMDSAPTGMAIVDDQRRFTSVNPALCRMLERDPQWLLSHTVTDVIHPDDDDVDRHLHDEVMTGRTGSHRVTLRMLTGSGGQLVVEHSAGVLHDENGVPVFQVSQFVDVTEAHNARQRLQFLASHDPLTSLANRHELMARMDELLRRPTAQQRLLGLLFLDLDDLKPVNDMFGHAVGDQLIVEVAHRISRQVRHDDLVARIGGDEFIVALPAIGTPENAVAIAEKIRRAVAQPLEIDGHLMTPTVSVGISVAGTGDEADRVISRADQALYRAKREGRGLVRLYDPDRDASKA